MCGCRRPLWYPCVLSAWGPAVCVVKRCIKSNCHVKDLRADAVVTKSAAEPPRLFEGVKSPVRVLLVSLCGDGFC